MKTSKYYCEGCDNILTRDGSKRILKTYCKAAGKTVTLKRLTLKEIKQHGKA